MAKKFKLSEVAKDLNMSAKDLIGFLEEKTGGKKSSSSSSSAQSSGQVP